MNPEMEGFHHGVDKCKETISNIVRSETINNKNCFERFLNILENKTFSRFKESRPSWNFIFERHIQKKKFSSVNATHKPKSKKVLMAGGKTKNPKGLRKRPNKMNGDKMFLRNLAQQLCDMDITGPWGESVTNKAQLRFERNPSVQYTNGFEICGVSGIIADNARIFCSTKPPATLPWKNLLTPHLYLYVLMKVSQI